MYKKLYVMLTGIQTGRIEDNMGWTVEVYWLCFFSHLHQNDVLVSLSLSRILHSRNLWYFSKFPDVLITITKMKDHKLPRLKTKHWNEKLKISKHQPGEVSHQKLWPKLLPVGKGKLSIKATNSRQGSIQHLILSQFLSFDCSPSYTCGIIRTA